MKMNPKIIQLVGDALIPILGFFFWHWDIYFIILFYLLDLFIHEVTAHISSGKIRKHSGESVLSALGYVILSWGLLLSSVALIHLTVMMIIPGIDFQKQIIAFWEYEELGIPQGIILVPLMLLVGIQRYRMEFVIPGRYKTERMSSFWKRHLAGYLFMLVLMAVGYAISQFVVFPQFVYVLAVVLILAVYSLFFEEVLFNHRGKRNAPMNK